MIEIARPTRAAVVGARSLTFAALMTGLVLLLSACSAAAQTAQVSSGSGATSTHASSAGSSGGTTGNPCKDLATSDVQPFFASPIAEGPLDDALISPAYGCRWGDSGGSSVIDVQIVPGAHASDFYAESEKPGDGGAPVAVSGVGDKAIRPAGDVWVAAMKNGVFCHVSGQHGGGLTDLTQYETSSAIPDSDASAEAQRLATLCNKLWGSGNTSPSF